MLTVKSLKPAVRTRESEHLEEPFSLQQLPNPCLRPDRHLSLCRGWELSCWSHDCPSSAPCFPSHRRSCLDSGDGWVGVDIRAARRKTGLSITFRSFLLLSEVEGGSESSDKVNGSHRLDSGMSSLCVQA